MIIGSSHWMLVAKPCKSCLDSCCSNAVLHVCVCCLFLSHDCAMCWSGCHRFRTDSELARETPQPLHIIFTYMGGSWKGGSPIAGWFISWKIPSINGWGLAIWGVSPCSESSIYLLPHGFEPYMSYENISSFPWYDSYVPLKKETQLDDPWNQYL